MTVELPGVKLDDTEITLEDGLLTIQGERHFANDSSEEQFHRVERRSGAFRRAITLPAHVMADAVNASIEDGVLRILVPKAEEAKPSASRSPRRPDGGHRSQLAPQLTIPRVARGTSNASARQRPRRHRRGPAIPARASARGGTDRQGSRSGHPALKRSMLSIVHGADCFGVRAQDVESDSRYPYLAQLVEHRGRSEFRPV